MSSPIEIQMASERSRRRIRRTLWTISLVVFPLFVFVVSLPFITRVQLRWRGWDLGSRDAHGGWFERVDQAYFRDGQEFAIRDIDRLSYFPQLKQMTVYNASISEDAFVAISRHNQLSTVRIISSR